MAPTTYNVWLPRRGETRKTHEPIMAVDAQNAVWRCIDEHDDEASLWHDNGVSIVRFKIECCGA